MQFPICVQFMLKEILKTIAWVWNEIAGYAAVLPRAKIWL
jgi:hypothetical protein